MQQSRGGKTPDKLAYLIQRLDSANLIVDQHHRYKRDVFAEQFSQGIHIYNPICIDRYHNSTHCLCGT
jgi:hypothetical protein